MGEIMEKQNKVIKLAQHKNRYCPFCGEKTFTYMVTLEDVVEIWECERDKCAKYLKIIVG